MGCCEKSWWSPDHPLDSPGHVEDGQMGITINSGTMAAPRVCSREGVAHLVQRVSINFGEIDFVSYVQGRTREMRVRRKVVVEGRGEETSQDEPVKFMPMLCDECPV